MGLPCAGISSLPHCLCLTPRAGSVPWCPDLSTTNLKRKGSEDQDREGEVRIEDLIFSISAARG